MTVDPAVPVLTRFSWSRKSPHDGTLVEEDDMDVDVDDPVRLSAETREAVTAVKFIATHLKHEDDFAEVILADSLRPLHVEN